MKRRVFLASVAALAAMKLSPQGIRKLAALQKALARKPGPMINGKRCSFASMEVTFAGKPFKGIKAVDYDFS